MPTPSFTPDSAHDLVKDGTWFRDAEGRYALFRGVNFAGRSKRPPYLPLFSPTVTTCDPSTFAQELQAVQPQLALLKSIGMNVVRLPVIWKALEPTPNPQPEQLLPEGVTYLNYVKRIIDDLYYNHGMFVLIDFHQDIAHEHYDGDGFPDWALVNTTMTPVSAAATDLKNTQWGLNYYEVPYDFDPLGPNNDELVRITLVAFWLNDLINNPLGLNHFPVRTHLEKTIGATARFFQALNGGAGHPGVLGYEAFNEPHQVGMAKPDFEGKILPQYYANVLREIRSSYGGQPGDTKSFLFVEPRMDWTTYHAHALVEFQFTDFTLTPETYLDTSALSNERAVFAFHYYDPWTMLYGGLGSADNMQNKQKEWPGVFQCLMDAANSRGLIPFMTEFGGSQDWQYPTNLPTLYSTQIRAYMDLQFQQIEANLLNAMYWQYDLYNTQDGKDNWNLENLSLLGPGRTPREIDIMARVYPMRSSAMPSLVHFDLTTLHSVIMLKGPVVSAPTVIYLPFSTHYAGGFEVRSTSPNVEWDATNQLLYWYPDRGKATNQLIICPAYAFNASNLPQDSQNLLSITPLSLAWPKQMQLQVTPSSIVLGVPTQVTVLATDSVTHAPVTGTVTIHNFTAYGQPTTNGFATGTTSVPITFFTGKVGPKYLVAASNLIGNGPPPPDPKIPEPTGIVTAANYLNASIPFTFLAQDASCTGQTVAPTMIVGTTYTATVTMQNTGTTTWVAGGNNPFHLGSQNPQDNLTWGLARVALSNDVAPGGTATFQFSFNAPKTTGSYNFQWRMVQEGVMWLGDATPNVVVNVVVKGKESKEGKEQKEGKERKELKENMAEKTRDGNITSTMKYPSPIEDQKQEQQHSPGEAFIGTSERPSIGQEPFI